MLQLRTEEITGLKQHVQTFNTENQSLKRLVGALEQAAKDEGDLEAENDHLKA